jgi:RNA polymerase sigma-70 factor (ECF subfamily)
VSDPERDEVLVRRYLDGDATAFAGLVERHQTRVFNLALRILGDPEDARDAAQETFLTALRKLSQFRGEAAFTTWLHRVAVNACYDSLRAKGRRPMLHAVADPTAPPPEGPPVPDHADEAAGSIDVARALREIPDEYRVAVVLADVQDLPYDEIAKVLDIPVGTVKSRVHRGRVALARSMGIQPAGFPPPAGTGRGQTRGGREPAVAPDPSKRQP